MKKIIINNYGMAKIFIIAIALFSLWGCKKSETLVSPPFEAHFTNLNNATLIVNTAPGGRFVIPIGLTNKSDKDQTVTFAVTSPTGAVPGTHYTIAGGNTRTIPAGKVLDSIVVVGIPAAYLSGRKDTLIFTITEPSVKASSYNKEFRLAISACLESDIDFRKLLGTYTKTFENGTYGPYNTTISSFTVVSATSGTATISNLWDNGYSAVVLFDWSVPGTFTATIAPQQVSATRFIRSTPGTVGTFTYCTPAFNMTLDLYTATTILDRWVMTMAR